MNGKQIFGLILTAAVVYLALDSVFTVDVRERVVVVQLGEIVGQDYDPGLHFKLPIVQDVRRFDRRILNLKGDIARVLTSENKNLTVDFFVKWRVTDTIDFYLSNQGSEARARSLLTEIVENDLLAEFSKRTIRQAVNDDRNEIVAAVKVQANDDARELGIEVVDVRVMRLDLPDRVTDSIYDRMRSERQEVIRTLRAQGDAAANEIRADAEREETIILADAYRQAQVIKGEGDAGAAGIYAGAYGKDTAFYSFYRSLELYRDTLGDNDILILEPKGELFEYFNPPAGR